jgi:hypothetical protein
MAIKDVSDAEKKAERISKKASTLNNVLKGISFKKIYSTVMKTVLVSFMRIFCQV